MDWTSYGEVLQASSRIMDNIAYHVTTLSKTKVIHLPILVAENVEDSKYVPWDYVPIRHLTSRNFRTVSRAIGSWLEDPAWLRVSSNVLVYIQSYEASGVGVYNDHHGRVVTLLKRRQIFPSRTSVLDYHNFSRRHWVLDAAEPSTPMFTSSRENTRACSSNSGTS